MPNFPFESALAEYNFLRVQDALKIADLSNYENHGALSGPALWTGQGLRLDGSQYITIPDDMLAPTGKDFTVFIVASSSNGVGTLIEWDTKVSINLTTQDGLTVKLENDGTSRDFYPTANNAFALVARFAAIPGNLDVRIASGTKEATNVSVDQQQGFYRFKAKDGVIGSGFSGTLFYFAIFDEYCSNGQMRSMLDFAFNALLERGIELRPSGVMSAPNLFQVDAFQ